MFRKNKWQEWWDNLPERDRVYLSKQPIWHDRDLYKAMMYGIVVGFVIGLMF